MAVGFRSTLKKIGVSAAPGRPTAACPMAWAPNAVAASHERLRVVARVQANLMREESARLGSTSMLCER